VLAEITEVSHPMMLALDNGMRLREA